MPIVAVTKINAVDLMTLAMFPVGQQVRFGDWLLKRQCIPNSGRPKIFISAIDTSREYGSIKYKFRITVNSDQLERALNLLISKLFSKDSPFLHFKITNAEAVANKRERDITAGKSPSIRLFAGGQITLYCSRTYSPVLYVAFLAEITDLLRANGLRVGRIPDSDMAISRFVSCRCELKTDETGALIEGVKSSRRHMSKGTAEAYLFHLARLFQIARVKINSIPFCEKTLYEAANKIVHDFTKKYKDDIETHHYDLIQLFLREVGEPLGRLLGVDIDFSEVTTMIKPKASLPGYGTIRKAVEVIEAAASASSASTGEEVDEDEDEVEKSTLSSSSVVLAILSSPSAAARSGAAASIDDPGQAVAASAAAADNAADPVEDNTIRIARCGLIMEKDLGISPPLGEGMLEGGHMSCCACM